MLNTFYEGGTFEVHLFYYYKALFYRLSGIIYMH